jgi:hypothetical protein
MSACDSAATHRQEVAQIGDAHSPQFTTRGAAQSE